MISISSGELRIEGRRATYELRIPLYEIQHVRQPEQALFDSIRFQSGGADGRIVEKSCRTEQEEGSYTCRAIYEFPVEVDRVEVECRFYSVTVPNHVHMLRTIHGEKTDQAVLDFSFPRADLRFRPPTPVEVVATQMSGGLSRALGGWPQILFLLSLVLAARTRRELVALAGMMVAGEVLATVVVPHLSWQPQPRFVEAAAALTIAYLAVEILLLPQAGQRWLVAGVLGLFQGLGFALFVRTTEYSSVWVLAGMMLGQLPATALLAWIVSRAGRIIPATARPVQVAASLLLTTGLVWFFWRLRGM
jgi:hypothetical protein